MWSDDDVGIMKENAFKVCQENLTGPWQEITLKDFNFSVVSGGLSNRLYYCSLPESHKVRDTQNGKFVNEVLLRVYGPIQDDVSVMVREAVIFTLLSEKNMGPKLYGIFQSGRLEQYIPSRSFNSMDIKNHSVTIAKEMAKIHCMHVPIQKHPKILNEFAESWLLFLEENVDKQDLKTNVRQMINRKELRTEMQWLKDLIEKKSWPVVFCHNDLQGGNILFRDDEEEKEENSEKSVLLIDFEFSCYNYRGFDIGNHFCEWCFDYNTKEYPFFEVDLKKFPTKSEQLQFIEAYLNEVKKHGTSYSNCSSLEEEKMNILHEVMVFRLKSHLLWTIWSFKMALSSSMNFGFWEYGKTRWDVYHKQKAELLKSEFCNGELSNGNSNKADLL